MDTLRFFERVLPAKGPYILAFILPGYSGFVHKVYATHADLAIGALQTDMQQGRVVYHACASYQEQQGKPHRTGDLTAAVRSQWIDIDVGDEGDPYATIREALVAVVAFCKALGIPAPLVVKSGGGLHCYWPFDRDVPAKLARHMMRAFVTASKAHGFAHDYGCAKDIARVLRPVGTHWRKNGSTEITLLRDAQPFHPAKLYNKLRQYATPSVAVTRPDEDDEWSTGPKDYPPSSALEIIKHCATLADIAQSKGNVDEPTWRSMLGLVKHCVEGEELAQEWSSGHPNYSEEETREKYTGWHAGPTTCNQFSQTTDSRCDGCPHAGKKSPIHLGYTEEAPSATAPAVGKAPKTKLTHTAYARQTPNNLPYWPKGYRWNNTQVEKLIPAEGETPAAWLAILSCLVYPYMRFTNEDGEMCLRCCVLHSGQTKWKEFDMPAQSLADNRSFAQDLAAHEVFVMTDKVAVHGRQFFKDIIHGMQHMSIETEAYNAFGWHDDRFVLGNSALTKASLEPVFLGERVPSDLDTDLGVKGTSEDWSKYTNQVYNRPGAEAYQFLLCASFGAPLIELVASNLWHGIPVALTGEGGVGKTTTCLVAASIYGDPSKFLISTNEDGSTMNALLTRVGIMRHLPLVLDEMTGRKVEEVQGMLYALSNGKPKERNKANGQLIDPGLSWNTFTFITGNMNITNMLASLDQHRAEATQLRCFEITVDEALNSGIFADLNAKDIIENKLLAQNYGVVGREYLTFVLRNRDRIRELLIKARTQLAPKGRDETRERYYTDTVAMMYVGGMIARKLGLIQFDMDNLRKWGLAHIKSLRTTRLEAERTHEEYLSEFFATLIGRTLDTANIYEGKGRPPGHQHEVDLKELRGAPLARVGRDDGKFYVLQGHFGEWCRKNNINARNILTKWKLDGLVTSPPEGVRTDLFKGTSLPATRVRVIQFDYASVFSGAQPILKLQVIAGGKKDAGKAET